MKGEKKIQKQFNFVVVSMLVVQRTRKGEKDVCEKKEEGRKEARVSKGNVERFLNELRIELIFSGDGGGDGGWAGGKTNHGACLAYRTLPASHPYVKCLSGSPVDDAQPSRKIFVVESS